MDTSNKTMNTNQKLPENSPLVRAENINLSLISDHETLIRFATILSILKRIVDLKTPAKLVIDINSSKIIDFFALDVNDETLPTISDSLLLEMLSKSEKIAIKEKRKWYNIFTRHTKKEYVFTIELS